MKILGYNYTVDSNRDSRELSDNVGRTYLQRQHISLARDQAPDGFLSTFIHEIIEVLDYHLELRLEHNKICSIEAGIFQALVDAGVDLTPLLKQIDNTDVTNYEELLKQEHIESI